jgi:hypothetical protein
MLSGELEVICDWIVALKGQIKKNVSENGALLKFGKT